MFSLPSAIMALALVGAPQPQTVLLDFTASWCGPCREMRPVVHLLASKGYTVQEIDIDQRRDLAAKFRVNEVPTFVMLVNGRVVDRQVGATDYGRLETMCRQGVAARADTPDIRIPPTPPGRGTAGASIQLASTVPGAKPATQLAAAPPSDLENGLISASVRLRITDAEGHSCGTGTIIDARQGEALILTCGHIFRESKGNGSVEVDLFGPTPATGIRGSVVSYDLESDVGLLAIPVNGPVAVARVAPLNYRPAKGNVVLSVGCNNGDNPTLQRSEVTALDKYAGPPNLEIAGQPVQGRSGGGLFSADGFLIGVCNAADRQDNEGLFAALPAIHAELDRSKLTYVYQAPGAPAELPNMPREMPGAAAVAQQAPASAATPAVATQPLATPEEQAVMDEIRRRQAEGAEVVVIVRPRNSPEAKSEVYMLEEASPDFLNLLSESARALRDRRLTSLEVPRTPATVLRMSSDSRTAPPAQIPNVRPGR